MNLPNYTQINNQFIDNMNKYNGNAVKVFLAISRKTIGWHKESDRISYSQLRKLTGLSTNSIKSAISILVKDGWIIQTNTDAGYIYDLNISKIDTEGYQKLTQGVSKIDTDNGKTVSKIDTTKESFKQTKQKKIKKELKNKYLDLVLLTDKEYNKLISLFGKDITTTYIERLNFYMMSKGKTYKSHYGTIRNWLNKSDVEPIEQTPADLTPEEKLKLEQQRQPLTMEV